MLTLTAVLFVLSMVIFVFLYDKMVFLWGKEKADGYFVILLIIPGLIAYALMYDLYKEFISLEFLKLFVYVFLCVVSIVSVGISLFSTTPIPSIKLNLPSPVRLFIELIGFISSIIGIISFFKPN